MELKKESLEIRAADALRHRILEGEIEPGSRLIEVELAKDFNISRGTLRTALHQLVGEGLIQQVPYTGWLVQDLSGQMVWELHTLRATYDRLANQLVASTMDEAKRQKLTRVYDNLVQACDSGEARRVAEADFHLHHTIVQLSGHSLLVEYYTRVEYQLRLYINWSTKVMPNCTQVAEDHRHLFEALCRGDADTAKAFTEDHNLPETLKVIENLKAEGKT